ncbi:MAG: T9SS type A sorting domain-containing protein [Ignavibacteriales bacterium]|nr:T9SS type A sorting domain-containing protein [Ignavibacteriales bacterium]
MKNSIFIISFILALTSLPLLGQKTDTSIDTIAVDSPWTIAGCVYRQNPTPPLESELEIMASGKAVILDIELCTNEILDKLNALDSTLLIGIYFNPMEIFSDIITDRPWQNSIRNDLLNNFYNPASSFFVYNPSHDQKIITTWDSGYSMWLMNLSEYCPLINNMKYNDYISAKIISRLNSFKTKIDFLLFDNGLRDIIWLGNPDYTITQDKLAPDIDWDSEGDWFQFPTEAIRGSHNTPIDSSWRNGTSKILKNLKDSIPIKIIVNQPNEFYYTVCDGKMFENIGSKFGVSGPSNLNYGSALKNPKDMLKVITDYFIPNNLFFNLIQSSNGQASASTDSIDETAMVMALLYDNALFCFAHNSIEVSEIAKRPIGLPTSEMKEENGLKIREFENGFVVFNPASIDKSFRDANIPLDVNIPFYRGKIILKKSTNVDINPIESVKNYSLQQNYPNPFNPSTLIRFALPFRSTIKIEVYNILGEKIKEILNEQKNAGYYEVNFNTNGLRSGVYFYLLYAKSTDGKSEFRDIKKMMLLK